MSRKRQFADLYCVCKLSPQSLIYLLQQRRGVTVADTSISQLARKHGIAPCKLSDLFYRRILSDEKCQIVNGRRVIPQEYVPELEAILRERRLIAAAAVSGEKSCAVA
jgi:hypothetical protein